jgi:hypothetical protein
MMDTEPKKLAEMRAGAALAEDELRWPSSELRRNIPKAVERENTPENTSTMETSPMDNLEHEPWSSLDPSLEIRRRMNQYD